MKFATQRKTKDMAYEVTIGIPLYKSKDYIRQTMLSALNQSYEQLEILVVDDCGNDGSLAIVEDLQEHHPRGKDIHILHNDGNKGVGPSRNRLIEEAQGRYLYFLDSDDVIEPNTIELLLTTIKKHHAEVVYASYEKVDQVNNAEPSLLFQYTKQVFRHEYELATYAFRNYGKFQTSVCNCLIDLTFLRESKLRFIDAMFWEDMAFTYELVTRVRRAVLLPDVTYHYLCRPYSLSNYQDREQLNHEEILKNVSTIDYLKWQCVKLREKPYIPYMCYNLEMNSFYIVCHVLKHAHQIVPAISNSELHQYMHFPLPLKRVLSFRRKFWGNFCLWFIAHLPTALFIPIIKFIGRKKGVL